MQALVPNREVPRRLLVVYGGHRDLDRDRAIPRVLQGGGAQPNGHVWLDAKRLHGRSLGTRDQADAAQPAFSREPKPLVRSCQPMELAREFLEKTLSLESL